MAKKYKTLYLKVPVDVIAPIERIADSQQRTTSGQVVMILKKWLDQCFDVPREDSVGKAGAEPNAVKV
jgi:hypothetical protein